MDSLRSITRSRPSNWWESIINFVILRLRYRVNGAHTELSYWPIWKMLNSKNCENRLIMRGIRTADITHLSVRKLKTEGAEMFHTRTICCHSHFTLYWEEHDGIWAWLYDLTPHCSLVLVIIAREERGGVSPPHSERRAQRCPGWDKTSVIWLSSKLVVTGITPLVLQHRWDFILFWRDRAVFQLMKW